jgi:dienelactone hydrolase
LNEGARNVLLAILAAVLPVALFLSWYLSRKQSDGEEIENQRLSEKLSSVPESKFKRIKLSLRRPYIMYPSLLIIAAIVITVIFRIQHQSKVQFDIDNAIPSLSIEFEQLMYYSNGEENWNIYRKAIELRKRIEGNPALDKVWYGLTVPFTINSNPAGAKVYTKPYSKPDTSWYLIGKTPLTGFPFPRGLSRVKIEKEDFIPQFDVVFKHLVWDEKEDTIQFQLFKKGELPEGMVYIPGSDGEHIVIQGYSGSSVSFNSFLMDRYEVSNEEYKIFMDAGGYTDTIYWEFPFVSGRDTLTFDEAKKRFVDKTGWIGPANWEQGDFPFESGSLPVTGISWYEAMAFSRFVNKSLPTIFHWAYVSEAEGASEMVKFSNFNKKGPVRRATYNSMTRFGTFDLPGNVSEWTYNSIGNDRYIYGGNYKEPTYLFNMPIQISPMLRNDLVGFRCIKYIDGSPRDHLLRKFDLQKRDYANLQPVSDEIFNVYKELNEFEHTELNPVRISKTNTNNWIQELISVNVPYEGVALKIYIFLPLKAKPPFQAVIYFPGIDAHNSNSFTNLKIDNRTDFILKSGRALVWPVYYSSFGRGKTRITNLNAWEQSYKNMIADVGISIDYLQTRNDIDFDRIAFYGFSWGSGIAPYILASEERIKLGMLALFGVSSLEKYRFKEFDQIDYVPRVKIPMLLLGGQYDWDYTMEQQQAFYDFLGTPRSDIRWKLYETTHWIPRGELINESLDWLDKYFGPVLR